MATTSPPLKSVKTGFDIIQALRELDGATLTELSEHLNMPTSSVHDYLRTLESEEYLICTNGEYRIGARFLELGEQFRSRVKLYEVGRPEVDDLGNRTGEHANLMVEEHGRGVFLYKAKGADAVKLDTHPGMRTRLHTTAMGKSILASRSDEYVQEIIDTHGLPPVTENTITDRGKLFEELEATRNRGYAIDDEERVDGMRCVAAPITDSEGWAIGAVSVSAPKNRLQGQTLEETFPEMILRSANVIEVNLAYS